MKSFLGTFGMVFILCFIFLLFGGVRIFENFWTIVVFVALVLTIAITVFMNQETRFEELEEKIKILESKIQ